MKGAPITDIERSVEIRIRFMSTANTNENTLTLPVGGVAVPAFVASLGRVTSVNRFNLDAMFAGDMLDFGKERRERPSVVDQALLFGNPDPVSNALKVFDDYRPRVGFQGFIHDLVGHIPEQPINRSLLFARQPFQEPSLVSALVPCGLKIAALFESALSNVLDNSALENLAGAGRGDTDDTGIDANGSVALRVGNILCGDQMQIPGLTFAGDVGSRLDLPRSVEVLPVVARKDQVDSNSACKRGQRGVLMIDLYCQSASVVSHRRRIFPLVVDGLISLVSFGHNAAGRANEIGGKLRQLTHVLISDVVKSDGVKDPLFKGDIRGVVERNIVTPPNARLAKRSYFRFSSKEI